MQIKWQGYASICIKTDKQVIYIDPSIGDYDDKADVIFITHDHADHWNRKVIDEISSDNTMIYAVKSVASQMNDAKVINEDGRIHLKECNVRMMPAYSIRRKGHQKGEGVGLIFEFHDRKIYYCGDTELIPEMKGVIADLVIVPVGGTTTADAREAVQIAKTCRAEYAIPVHWGYRNGTIDDAELFKELCDIERIDVFLMRPGDALDL